MANIHKGEVSFEANGTKYTLSFSADSIAELEDMLDMSWGDLGSLMQDRTRFRVKVLRKIFHAGLLDHHPDITEETVRGILRTMDATSAVELFNQAMTGAEAENPPKGSATNGAQIGAGS